MGFKRNLRKIAWRVSAGLISIGMVSAPAMAEGQSRDGDAPSETAQIAAFCEEMRTSIKALKWNVDPCPSDIQWKIGGYSVEGRPLLHADLGNPGSLNTPLIFSMVHGDEVTPLYLGLELLRWVRENSKSLGDHRMVIAPMVNPDSFFKKPRSRVNSRGAPVNRNCPTRDWDARAKKAWKDRFKSHPRRFPGHVPDSEPETRFQRDLIASVRPLKILSVHAPLNFMDYDGPTHLSLAQFPKDYVQECLKLRKSLKATSGGFFPGSLGNYAGQELGIPTLTLELPSADPAKARVYWERFRHGIKTMIEYRMPDVALRAMNDVKL